MYDLSAQRSARPRLAEARRIALGVCLGGLLVGCAQSDQHRSEPAPTAQSALATNAPAPATGTPTATARVRGKPRDVDPALSYVLPAFSLAVEFAETRPGTSPRLIRLVGLHGEVGTVTILHAPTDGSLRFLRTELEMTIETRVGLAADGAKARELARALAERIEELAKRE